MRTVRRAAVMGSLLLIAATSDAGAQALDVDVLDAQRIDCSGDPAPIALAGFIRIGGIEQWVTVDGADCRNPVVLVLHGGPGSPLSPYAGAIYGPWRGDFTVVQWDQRGSGRTYGRDPAADTAELSIERMTEDGIELASWLVRSFGARKLFLVGGSWGSVLGVHMVDARPDLFHAYIGTSQLVDYRANQESSYRALSARAEAAGDSATIAALRSMGPPPWTNPRNFGIVRRMTRAYEAQVVDAAPDHWWNPAPPYASAEGEAERERGDDYSYLQFVGVDGSGMFSRVDLRALGTDFGVPIYLVHGAEDLVTTPDVARAWLEEISAPAKRFVLLPRTGHDPNVAMIDVVYSILRLP